jgi:hypothetical protein
MRPLINQDRNRKKQDKTKKELVSIVQYFLCLYFSLFFFSPFLFLFTSVAKFSVDGHMPNRLSRLGTNDFFLMISCFSFRTGHYRLRVSRGQSRAAGHIAYLFVVAIQKRFFFFQCRATQCIAGAKPCTEEGNLNPRFVWKSHLYIDFESVIATLQGLKPWTGVRGWEKRR